jgi:4-amino-4-deoxychorismate lyase
MNLEAQNNQILINGKPSTGLSALDRGIAYGDGVFRTFLVKNGVPQHWPLQYQKLSQDCQALGLTCPNEQDLLQEIEILFRDGADAGTKISDAVAKIIVTRGAGGRGYAVPNAIQTNRILIKSAMPVYPAINYTHGIKLHLCQLKLGLQPKLAGVKHLNRLENVLARMEWDDATIADGLLMDSNDQVIECTMSNIFARFGNELITPALEECGVAGIARARIIERAKDFNLAIKITAFKLDRLMQADEIIICNSLFGAWQVIDFNGQHWSKQGLTAQLREMLLN